MKNPNWIEIAIIIFLLGITFWQMLEWAIKFFLKA